MQKNIITHSLLHLCAVVERYLGSITRHDRRTGDRDAAAEEQRSVQCAQMNGLTHSAPDQSLTAIHKRLWVMFKQHSEYKKNILITCASFLQQRVSHSDSCNQCICATIQVVSLWERNHSGVETFVICMKHGDT